MLLSMPVLGILKSDGVLSIKKTVMVPQKLRKWNFGGG